MLRILFPAGKRKKKHLTPAKNLLRYMDKFDLYSQVTGPAEYICGNRQQINQRMMSYTQRERNKFFFLNIAISSVPSGYKILSKCVCVYRGGAVMSHDITVLIKNQQLWYENL